MLDKYNVHCKSFRMARDRYAEQPFHDLKLRLIADRQKDGQIYNMPMVSEVAVLIIGGVDSASPRGIIMESRTCKLQRINELHIVIWVINILYYFHMVKMVIGMILVIAILWHQNVIG